MNLNECNRVARYNQRLEVFSLYNLQLLALRYRTPRAK
jgi:hypothetical protein